MQQVSQVNDDERKNGTFLKGGNMAMIAARMENFGITRGNIFWAAPLDLGPQIILGALRAAFGNLESTFGPSKTMPELQKVENLEKGCGPENISARNSVIFPPRGMYLPIIPYYPIMFPFLRS